MRTARSAQNPRLSPRGPLALTPPAARCACARAATDKFSINQANITEGLASLPVNLAGCARLVCLLGPSYLDRLWCLLELHTFSLMGGDASNLDVLPIGATFAADDLAGAAGVALERVSRFTLRHATCFDPTEREHLLDVIASGCGSHGAFERILRGVLTPALEGRSGTRGRRRSFTSKRLSFTSTSKKRQDSMSGNALPSEAARV